MVSSTPRPHFTPGKDPVPILQEVGWAPCPVLMGVKSRPHRDSTLDRPAPSQSLYRLSYPAQTYSHIGVENQLKIPVSKFSEMELVPIRRYLDGNGKSSGN